MSIYKRREARYGSDAAQGMHDVRNILFIKLKSMGDVVFTLPAVRLLRENFPSARITYLTSAENEPIAAGFTEVDDLLVLDRTIYKRGKILYMAAATLEFLKRLRRGHFSLIIDLQCYAETAAIGLATHARRRWGYQIGSRLRRFAYTRSLPRPDNLHPVDANLALLTHFGLKPAPVSNRLVPPKKGRAEAGEFFAQNRLDLGRPTLFIQPFTSSPNKNWPLANHLAVANHWRAEGLQVVFGGGPREREQLASVMDAGFPVCAGLPLPTVAWVVHQATLVLGGDTGLLHFAVAMGKRVAMVMTPWGSGSCIPYGHPEWVIAPARTPNLAEIEPDVVNRTIAAGLAE